MPVELGTEWRVEQVVRVTDGDTVRLVRSRPVALDGRTYRLTDDEPAGIPVRLVWVDTPERGKPGYTQAKLDLLRWINDAGDRWLGLETFVPAIRVICYESAGWDRLLGDLIDADGNSASQWLMTEKGWPPYVG